MSWFGNTNAQPKQPKKFANISNDQVNSNQQAVPVKYLAGRAYVAGDYITPAYNPIAKPVKTKTGKDSTSTTGYKYYADFALMFCMGGRRPVDAIYKVIVDSDIRWSGNVQRGVADYETIAVDGLGTLNLYWGSETQAIDAILLSPRGVAGGGTDPQDATTWPENAATGGAPTFGNKAAGDPNPFSGHYDQHPAYRGQCYGVFQKWFLGRDRTSVPNIQLELKRGCPWFSSASFGADDSGINPIAVLYDWLTDPRFGMGLPDSQLSGGKFSAAYAALEATTPAARISPLISQQEDFRQIVAELLEYYDGWIRRNGSVIEVGFWAKGTDIVSAATLTDNDLLAEPALEPQGWGPTMNEVTIVYKDKDHHYNDYVQTHRDPNNFRITGGPRPVTLQRPWITDTNLAKAYAKLTGNALAMPFTRGTLDVKREWISNNSLLPGVVFTYDSAFYGLAFLLRLLEIEYAADDSAKAVMTVEWERSKWPAVYIPPGFQGPGGFHIGPRAIWISGMGEVPYLLADQKFDTQLLPAAVRGNVEVQGFRIWLSFDGGATYQLMPNEQSTSQFASYGRVQTAITAGNTGVMCNLYGIDLDDVVSQTAAQQADDNLLVFIGSELMSVGQVNPFGAGLYQVFFLRGRYGTVAASHAIGDQMFFLFRDRLRLLNNAQFTPGTVVTYKYQPFTADTDYDLSAITPQSYTIVGFADIPTPVFDPPGGTFTTSLVLNVSNAPAGCKLRYTTDGTAVIPGSPEWPGSGAGTITLTASTTVRARYYSLNSQTSSEALAHYTLTTGTLPTTQCAAPGWSYSGVLNHTTGNLTLTITTAGSTIKYTLNGGATTTYTTPLALAMGDVVDFWAIKSGLLDSQHHTIDNYQATTYGGGDQTGHPLR
jgi:hypothetical protein